MLTVNIKDEEKGTGQVFECHGAILADHNNYEFTGTEKDKEEYDINEFLKVSEDHKVLMVTDESGHICSYVKISSKRIKIYVMNDKGDTVASY